MGKVMAAAKARFAGTADMSLVSAAVKQRTRRARLNAMTPARANASTPTSRVAPQLAPDAMAEAGRAASAASINNRPDFEGGPDQPTSAAIEAAAARGRARVRLAAGRARASRRAEEIARFAELLGALPKPILAFCRSGTRSGRLWQAANSAEPRRCRAPLVQPGGAARRS